MTQPTALHQDPSYAPPEPRPAWHRGVIVGFDLETTGTDPVTARIVTAALTYLGPDGAAGPRQQVLGNVDHGRRSRRRRQPEGWLALDEPGDPLILEPGSDAGEIIDVRHLDQRRRQLIDPVGGRSFGRSRPHFINRQRRDNRWLRLLLEAPNTRCPN